MVQSLNQISLYNKLTSSSIQKIGLEISKPKISYISNNEYQEILLDDEFENILTINKYDSMWSPLEHDLEISQVFSFKNPSLLYNENGVTLPGNKIGLAVRINSKSSCFQETVDIDVIPNIDGDVSIHFFHRFLRSSLRGEVELNFFIFLKECNVYSPKHASKVGMSLSDGYIESLAIIVDGEGSVFPMSEFNDKNGALWQLDINWVEASLDTFDASNVNLKLNISHPLFEKVKSGKHLVSKALMGDIMIQAMSMIIQQVVIVEGCSLDDLSESFSNSILSVVAYWVSTFNIDTSSLSSITNSMNQYWDRRMINGGTKND